MTDIALPVAQTRAEGLLGASDAAAALGLDKYRSPLTVWRQLRGLPVNEERSEALDEAARWGLAIEPIVRGQYALQNNATVYVPEESTIKDGWIRATPDGFVATHGDVHQRGITVSMVKREMAVPIAGLVQVKCRSAWQRDEYMDGVPASVEIQCRVEMAVTDLPWNDCAILLGGNKLVVHRVERDLELESNVLRDLRAFWSSVQSGTEPPVDGSAAWREYASERMRPSPVVLDADESTEALVAEWLAARKARKALESKEDECKTRLLLQMSAAGATKIRSRQGIATAYRAGGRTDWRKYATDLLPFCRSGIPKIDGYKRQGTTWALKAPDSDED